MTKAACKLILRIGSLSLSWRTFKTLKRFGKENNSNDIDWEILQLWSLYAFQIMFSRVEWIASFVPFYYYFKMILLLVTFVPGTKFPNYWFELILIPFMHYAHRILNSDWKGFIKKEAILLPFQLIDLFLLPGFFTSDQQIEAVIYLREKQLEEVSQSMLQVNSKIITDNSCMTTEKNVYGSKPMSPECKGIELGPESGASWSRVAASSPQLRKLSVEYRRHSLPNVIHSPTRQKLRPTPENDPRFSPPSNKPTSFNLRRRSKESSFFDSQKSSSTTNDIAEDIITDNASSEQFTIYSTRRTKLMNETISTPTRKRNTVKLYSPRTPEDASELLNKLVQDSYDDDVSVRSGRSSSLGNGMRRLITGNPNIRIRDYLFDLDLPSIPSGANMSPNVRKRISASRDRKEMLENRRNGWNIKKEIATNGVRTSDSSKNYKLRRSRRIAESRNKM